jgi:hypothetical protein
MNEGGKDNIRLIGKNLEDLKVISAYSQDAIVSVKNIVFLKKNRIFIMIMDRFIWEDVEKGIFRENKRIKCALKFEEVLKVKSKKINQKNKIRRLELLAIRCNNIPDDNYEIKFFFAGDGVITLISEAIESTLHDLGESWNVKYSPKHKI